MNRAILTVWWAGLIGALVATLVILKQVALVLRVLRDILRLSERTRDAAWGVAANVSVVPQLAELAGPAHELRAGAGTLAALAASLARRLDSPAAGSSPRGG